MDVMEKLSIKVKVTKDLYKAFDSYNRRQKWVLKELVKNIKGRYNDGMAKAEQVSER